MFTMNLHSLSLMLLGLSLVDASTCPIQFDGRVPRNMSLAGFDMSSSPYNPSYVFGQNLAWSEIIKFPSVAPSMFDVGRGAKPIEVTISNASVFAPSPTNVQYGFRRAELFPASNTGLDASTTGIKTLHFSLMADTSRPLNLSHEYQLVFLETNDYSTNQFALKIGNITDYDGTVTESNLVLQGNVEDQVVQTLFETPFMSGMWHNFALLMDFDKNTIQVYYSMASMALDAVTAVLSNDMSGQGQFHFGVLKKPTGEGLTDITTQGYQEPDIDEGIMYSGIFEEDSSTGCISLAP